MCSVKINDADSSLIEEFVGSFAKLDEMSAEETTDPVAWELSVGERDEYGFKRWQPIRSDTPRTALEGVYAKLPGRFPRLYERLVLSYRWAEVELESYRLLANPLGQHLNGLVQEMSKDPILWTFLLRAGYIRFGIGPGGDYDPVCFDLSSRKDDGDCRIVKIDHEEILCNERLKVVSELAPTFKSLVLRTIDAANQPSRMIPGTS
jgi:hypothetical protein